jgi:hypothetical protein
MDVKTILQRVKDEQLNAGGAVSAELLEQLRRHRQQQKRFFIFFEVITVVALGVCVYFLLSSPSNNDMAKTLAGLLGLPAGTGGGIEMMRRAWREWSRADLLLLLLSEATESQVNAIVEKLAVAL